MKRRIAGLIVVLIALFMSSNVLAQTNILYVKSEDSKREVLINRGDKLFLDKQWYNYTFEVNPKNTIGKTTIKEVDSKEYQIALAEISFPLEKVGEYRIFFLNYRLKDFPTARAVSFMDNSVVVFGTYYPLDKVKIHQLAVHEFGHQVDFKLMDQNKWNEYQQLRGLTDSSKYNNSVSTYENRPQEIFAEDFRILCGGEKATQISHLNKNLPEPKKVPGLEEFFTRLKA